MAIAVGRILASNPAMEGCSAAWNRKQRIIHLNYRQSKYYRNKSLPDRNTRSDLHVVLAICAVVRSFLRTYDHDACH